MGCMHNKNIKNVNPLDDFISLLNLFLRKVSSSELGASNKNLYTVASVK
jgi:hypothetical protein